jgi:hypothetical protein
MGYWDDFKKRRISDGDEEREVGEVLEERFGALRASIAECREKFYCKDWSREEASLELARIRHALQHRENLSQSRTFLGGALDILQGLAAKSHDVGYLVGFPRTELEQMAGFLERRLAAPAIGSGDHKEKLMRHISVRLADIEADLFEQIERPSITRTEGQKLYKNRRLAIQRDETLSPDDKEDELERLETDFRRWLRKHGFSIFEDDV